MKKFFHVLLICIFTFSLVFFSPVQASTGTPPTLSYQGHLTDSGGNLLGGAGTTYYFKFSFWDSPTVGSGSKVWPLVSPGSSALTVKQGVFSVNIGDIDNGYPDVLDYNFNTNSKIYLQVEISSDNVTFETLSPRSPISSSAFSQVANQVNGTAQSSFGTTTPITNSLISAITTSINQVAMTIKGLAGQVANLFNIQDSSGNPLFTVTAGGNVGVGTSTPTSALTVNGTSTITQGLLVGNSNNMGGYSSPLVQFPDGSGGYGSSGLYVTNSGSSQLLTFKAGNGTPLTMSNSQSIFSNQINANTTGGSTTPAYSFQNDTNTGIFRAAADVLGFSTNGAERLRITDTGNIGIGTMSPTSNLEIFDSGVVPSFKITSNAASASASPSFSLASGSGAGNYTIAQLLAIVGSGYTQSKLSFNVADASKVLQTRMVIDVNGNVGIGTTTPANLFHSYSTAINSGIFSSTQSSASQSGDNTTLVVKAIGTNLMSAINIRGTGSVAETYNSYLASGSGGGLTVTGGTNVFNVQTGGTPGTGSVLFRVTNNSSNNVQIFNQTAGALALLVKGAASQTGALQQWQDSASNVLGTFTAGGYLGIGTTTPQGLLHVYNASTTLAGTPKLLIEDQSGVGYPQMFTVKANDNSDPLLVFRRNTTTNGNYEFIVRGGSGVDYMSISSYDQRDNSLILARSGNVGIGKTAPAYKLDVSGDINIAAGSLYKYNGTNIVYASTTKGNLFFGTSGNLTATGISNTFIGNGGSSLTTGADNVLVGGAALQSNQSGSRNFALGNYSLFSNISGTDNISVGQNGLKLTTGSQNVGIGNQAGQANTTGTKNTFIGFEAGDTDGTTATLSGLTNATAIGSYAQVQSSNSLILGGTGSYAVNVGIGTAAPASTGGSVLNVSSSGYLQALFSSTASAGGFGLKNSSGYQYEFQSDPSSRFTIYDRNAAAYRFNIGSNGNVSIGTVSDLGSTFNVQGSGYFSGNVGIGTTTPGSTLDVNGGISISSSTAQLKMPNGTVALPSMSFIGDSTTGFHWGGGAGRIAASLSGVSAYNMTSGSSGYVWNLRNDMSLRWNSSGLGGYNDTGLSRIGVGKLAVGAGGASSDMTVGDFSGTLIAGNIGIGTTTPSAQLTTTGAVRFGALTGAGASLIVDANGNVTVSSDERLKNIQNTFNRGLADIEKINPIVFKWKPETGYDTENTYAGFSAQNIQLAIPEAIATDTKGFLTLADRPILATLVNAVKEIAQKIFDMSHIFKTKEICLEDSSGQTCITKTQLDALLLRSGEISSSAPTPPPTPTPIPAPSEVVTEEPPTPTPPPTSTPTTEPEPVPVESVQNI